MCLFLFILLGRSHWEPKCLLYLWHFFFSSVSWTFCSIPLSLRDWFSVEEFDKWQDELLFYSNFVALLIIILNSDTRCKGNEIASLNMPNEAQSVSLSEKVKDYQLRRKIKIWPIKQNKWCPLLRCFQTVVALLFYSACHWSCFISSCKHCHLTSSCTEE